MKIRTFLLAGFFGLFLLPLLAQSPQEVSMYQTAEKSYLAGSYQNAFEQLNDYVRTYPSGAYILAAVYNRGNSLAMLKRYDEALSDYDYVTQAGNNPYSTSAKQRAQQVKDKMAAKQAQTTSGVPTSTTGTGSTGAWGSSTVPTTSGTTSTLPSSGPYQSYAERNPVLNAYFAAVSAFNAFNYGLAEPFLQTVINTDPGELGAEARYMQAKIQFIKGDYNRARDLSRAAAAANQSYPYWVAKSVLVMSDALYELNDLNGSRAVLEGLAKDYNQDPAVQAEARKKLARFGTSNASTTTGSSYPRPR